MKVLLFTNFGNNYITPEMLEIMNKSSFPRNRIGKIIDYVVNKSKKVEKWENFDVDDVKAYFKKNENGIINLDNLYIYWNKDIEWITEISIAEVDNSRPWMIDEYDGSEYIQYLDYKIIDKEMNYCKLKEDN